MLAAEYGGRSHESFRRKSEDNIKVDLKEMLSKEKSCWFTCLRTILAVRSCEHCNEPCGFTESMKYLITIKILGITHRRVIYLKRDVSETGWCLRLQFGPLDTPQQSPNVSQCSCGELLWPHMLVMRRDSHIALSLHAERDNEQLKVT